MNRRTFLISSAAAFVGALLSASAVGNIAETDSAKGSPGIPARASRDLAIDGDVEVRVPEVMRAEILCL
jgi:hypothetical protein